jgi:hypothetical protein
MQGSDNNNNNNRDMAHTLKELIISTIIPLLGLLLLVSPGIMVAEGQQQ